jgi:hypothetical protein
MRNKIILLASLLPSLCAAALPSIPQGFYLGASTAVTDTSIYHQLRFDPSETLNTYLYNRNQSGSTAQVQPGVLVGYEYILNGRWLMAAEFQANFLKSYINASGNGYIANTLTTNSQYALQVRLGTSLTSDNDFIYALVGTSRSEAELKIDFDNSLTTEGQMGALQLGRVNGTTNISGLKVGVGYEHHINRNLGLRVDFSHTNYGSFKNNLFDPGLEFLFPESGTSKISETVNMIGITLLVLS